MKCKKCGAASGRVVDSRPTASGITRRRECDRCAHRWSTKEVDLEMLEKMKRYSYREDFMAAAESELNKAFFRTMERLKGQMIPDATDAYDDDGIIIPIKRRAQ